MNIPLGQWSGSDATKQLEQTIIKLQEENRARERWMLWLTMIAAIAAVIAAAPVVQVWLG